MMEVSISDRTGAGQTEGPNRWRMPGSWTTQGRIRSSGIGIYLECGDRDSFGLNEAAAFMRQILMKNHIEHEYRRLHGPPRGPRARKI
jgi:hypothetical protein